MRRAQTTNERMSVAYSAFQEWSDEESPRRHHSPLYLNRSTELQSSDDEGGVYYRLYMSIFRSGFGFRYLYIAESCKKMPHYQEL